MRYCLILAALCLCYIPEAQAGPCGSCLGVRGAASRVAQRVRERERRPLQKVLQRLRHK